MMRYRRRRLLLCAVMTATLGLAGCPGDNGPTPPPDEFARVVVNEVLGTGGGAHTWLVDLDLENQEGNGEYFLRFLGPDDCVSETAVIFVPAGRDWQDNFAVNCRLQPRQVITFSQRESGFMVTDRDSIPEVVEP